jgi:hypothetical protein
MAKASLKLIEYLKLTSERLESGASYSWGNLGKCNCGHLIQTITKKNPDEIHRIALNETGEWTELANDYCENSGLEMNSLIESLLNAGLSRDDIKHLEHLDDKKILSRIDHEEKFLNRNQKEHVILYLNEWANLLEEELKPKYMNEFIHHFEKETAFA